MGTVSAWGTIRSYSMPGYYSGSGFFFQAAGPHTYGILGSTSKGIGFNSDIGYAQIYGDLVVNGNIQANNLARSFTSSGTTSASMTVTFPASTNRNINVYAFAHTSGYSTQINDDRTFISGWGTTIAWSVATLSSSTTGMSHWAGTFASSYGGNLYTVSASANNNTGYFTSFAGTLWLSAFVIVN